MSEISQLNFSCGHIVAESNGGPLTAENIKPICASCNSSMRTSNMDEFIKKFNLDVSSNKSLESTSDKSCESLEIE